MFSPFYRSPALAARIREADAAEADGLPMRAKRGRRLTKTYRHVYHAAPARRARRDAGRGRQFGGEAVRYRADPWFWADAPFARFAS